MRWSRSNCSIAKTAFTVTPADTDLFLDRAKSSYIGGVLEMANARLYGYWGSLTEALRTGEAQNESKDGGEDLLRQTTPSRIGCAGCWPR